MLCDMHVLRHVQYIYTCNNVKHTVRSAYMNQQLMINPVRRRSVSTRVWFRPANRNRIFPLGYAVLVYAFVPCRSIELVTIVAVVMDDAPDLVVGVILLDVSMLRWVGLGTVHGMVLSICPGTGPGACLSLYPSVYSRGYNH